jgi:hypothetical protein
VAVRDHFGEKRGDGGVHRDGATRVLTTTLTRRLVEPKRYEFFNFSQADFSDSPIAGVG